MPADGAHDVARTHGVELAPQVADIDLDDVAARGLLVPHTSRSSSSFVTAVSGWLTSACSSANSRGDSSTDRPVHVTDRATGSTTREPSAILRPARTPSRRRSIARNCATSTTKENGLTR